MEERAAMLQRLADRLEPVRPLLDALSKFAWDWDGEPLLILQASHFRGVFARFLAGELTAKDLEEWTDCFECREDVALDPKDHDVLGQLLFCLANPLINYELTPDTIKRFQEWLGA